METVEAARAQPYRDYSSQAYRNYVLAALLAIYTLSVVDRILIALLQEDIKRELGLSDLQLGILGGPAFVFMYTFAIVPIARYADRTGYVKVIAIGAAVWSAATAACGLAQNFMQLLVARATVGIGEASCMPSSHSLLTHYFPANQRARALAIYGLGIPIGTLLAAFSGGWLLQSTDWRTAFLLLGLPGLLAAALLKFTLKEPARRDDVDAKPGFFSVIKVLGRKPAFWHMTFAGSLVAIFAFSMAQFLVSYLLRRYGLEPATASYAFGAINGFGAAISIYLGGYLCDRLSGRFPKALSQVPAVAMLIAAPTYFLAFQQSSFLAGASLLMLAMICLHVFTAPIFTVAQSLAEPGMRATSSALMIMIITLAGYGAGPPLTGAIADYITGIRLADGGLTQEICRATPQLEACVTASAQGLQTGLTFMLIAVMWASLHFWLAGRTLLQDRVS